MTVERCPRSGCGTNRVVLATGGYPHALVVSGNALYWATDNDNAIPASIWRLAR